MNASAELSDRESMPNAEWNVFINVSSRVESYPEFDDPDFAVVEFEVVMERKSLFYTLTQIIPTTTITLLTLIGLFSPTTANHDRNERVTIGLTALLSVSVILMAVAGVMPKNPDQFPIMGLFLLHQVITISLGTVISVAVLHWHALQTTRLKTQKLDHAALVNFCYRLDLALMAVCSQFLTTIAGVRRRRHHIDHLDILASLSVPHVGKIAIGVELFALGNF